MTTYTITRPDGDNIQRGLSKAEAAAAICEIKGWPNDGRDEATFAANLRDLRPCGVYTDTEYDEIVAQITEDDAD